MCFPAFNIFKHLLNVSFHLKLNVQTDWGGEYHKLNKFFKTIGIHHRLICSHTHEENGTIDHHHRHIVETSLF